MERRRANTDGRDTAKAVGRFVAELPVVRRRSPQEMTIELRDLRDTYMDDFGDVVWDRMKDVDENERPSYLRGYFYETWKPQMLKLLNDELPLGEEIFEMVSDIQLRDVGARAGRLYIKYNEDAKRLLPQKKDHSDAVEAAAKWSMIEGYIIPAVPSKE